MEFVTLRDGEDQWLIPFTALEAVRLQNSIAWSIDRTGDALRKDGVRYEKPVDRLLDPKACERANRSLGRRSR